ncbi:MAG TPA: DJ-1/PfpI family protein [Desulfuromonadales bacterium]|nr:DJ-1/PfpI family protein [Desulfuromonadales bacterium]
MVASYFSPELTREFFRCKKPAAAVCHGPQILAAAGVIEGKTSSACPAVGPDVEQAGGTWPANNETSSDAHIDGNLVTAPAWPAHSEWIGKFLGVIMASRTEP